MLVIPSLPHCHHGAIRITQVLPRPTPMESPLLIPGDTKESPSVSGAASLSLLPSTSGKLPDHRNISAAKINVFAPRMTSATPA